MEESTRRAFLLTHFSRAWNIPSSLVFSNLPSVERTCQSSSTSFSHCSPSDAVSAAPLNVVTTSISCCHDNDDESDVSSVSSGGSLVPRRSIFSSYWITKGSTPGSLRRVPAAVASVGGDGEQQDDGEFHRTKKYERTFNAKEHPQNSAASGQGRAIKGSPTSDRSVSFCPEVKVVVFTCPTEQRASNGWMDYFV